jgi:hypothetical protein
MKMCLLSHYKAVALFVSYHITILIHHVLGGAAKIRRALTRGPGLSNKNSISKPHIYEAKVPNIWKQDAFKFAY